MELNKIEVLWQAFSYGKEVKRMLAYAALAMAVFFKKSI